MKLTKKQIKGLKKLVQKCQDLCETSGYSVSEEFDAQVEIELAMRELGEIGLPKELAPINNTSEGV